MTRHIVTDVARGPGAHAPHPSPDGLAATDTGGAFSPCVLIPVYNHPEHIARIVDTLVGLRVPVLLIDDGSNAETREVLADIAGKHAGHAHAAARNGGASDATTRHHAAPVTIEHLPANAGKGAAVVHGLQRARALGHTHALQVDADGQHDLDDVLPFLDAARARPDAVICGTPRYDASVPKGRLYGRYVTHFWVWVETLSFDIEDSMCGFRVYPLAATCAMLARTRVAPRMAFDTDILVRLYWRGIPVENRRTRVTYRPGGISHFRMVRDNVGISWMHTTLVCGMLPRVPRLLLRKWRRRPSSMAPTAAATLRARQADEFVTPATASPLPETPWWRLNERGSALGLRLLAWACRLFGLGIARACLVPVVAYFALTDARGRAASRLYQQRLRASTPELALPPASAGRVFRHMLTFANAALDKFAAWSGLIGEHQVDIVDVATLDAAAANPRGALVIGSHLGNLEMTRALARARGIDRIHAVVYTRHAQRFKSMLAGANDAFANNLIEVDDIGPATAIMLRERVDQGDWLVIVGDRVPANDDGRVVYANFLGTPAPFAQGPFILASLLECPVYLLFCMRDEDRKTGSRRLSRPRYRLYFEAFADAIDLPRRTRQITLTEYAARYAQRLEHYCRRYPLQWFNFFDFWQRKAPKT